MKRRQRPGDAAPLSPWADDWVSARERSILGDREANALAFERYREESKHRPPVVIDFDQTVVPERPEITDRSPDDATALEVFAGREAILAGDLMPWLAKGASK